MKIEELPPDISPSTFSALETNGKDTTPALPPHMSAHRSKTTEEILSELNDSPLFMTSMVENDATEALRALVYEGTPLEVAGNFKEQGNEFFKMKRWSDAREFYGKGVDVSEGWRRERDKRKKSEGNEEGSEEEEGQEEMKLLETCLLNRAACHLELKNYRSCMLDCGNAMRINPNNVKAYYRSSKALLALGKILEADDACARGLAIDSQNEALKGLAKEIIKKNEEAEAKRRKEVEREDRRKNEELTLKAALKARGIKTRKTVKPSEMEDAKIQLLPDAVDPRSELSFPTVVLYPLVLESDFVKAFGERDTLGDHLGYLLPVPWDKKGEYTLQGVEGYMESLKAGLVKVGKKVPLLKVLSEGNLEIVNEVVRIFLVPKAEADEWVKDFKMKKAAEMRSV